MKIFPENRLFWFLKEGISLGLSDPFTLEMYLQQVITRGRMEDVRFLLKVTTREQRKSGLEKLKRFLPTEVRMFWEDFVAAH